MWVVRNYFSKAHLTLLTDSHGSKGYVSMRDLLPEGVIFDEVISYEAGAAGMSSWNMLKLLPRLREGRFDTLVYLAPRRRTGWQVRRDLAFFRLAGTTRFFAHRGFAPFPPRMPGKPLPFVEHEADHLLSRLALSGIPVPPLEERRIDLRLSGEELAAARGWLQAQIRADQLGTLIGVGPGARIPANVWPEDRYMELVRALINELGVYPVVFGGPELSALGDRLVAAWGCGLNAAGRLSVRQAAAALSHCRLFVGNDTGTTHLATAANTPCVGIYGARNWPGEWYPYGVAHRVLHRSVACEGCRLVECVEYDMACLKQITVSEVFEACRAALSGGPASVAQTPNV
jgi:ADP-heptose:LPS heptosyltransferase